MSGNNGQSNANVPFQRSQSADFAIPQPRSGLLATHSSGTLPTMPSPISFQRRTVENARQLRDSLNNVIREIEPLMETARTVREISFSNLLHGSQSQTQNSTTTSEQTISNNSNYVAINLENSSAIEVGNSAPLQENLQEHAAIFLDADNNQNNNNTEAANASTDARQALSYLLKYLPFVFILIAKAIYDNHEGLFILIILFSTFAHTNSAVKREALKRARRSVAQLAIELVYICACLLFIHYVFEDNVHNFNLAVSLVLIRTFTHPLTVWNLLWIVTITDFILKLITVTVKIFLTMLPGWVIEFKKRGKIYLFIEAVSQLYRSIATIQPWLYYLLESYQGPEKIVAVFLSAFYMISKGSDLMFRVKLLKIASIRLLQSVSIGSTPSKEQIQNAGEYCPICQDKYDSPVMLECKHIFCEACVTTWFDREQTCPLCRAKIVDDPSWRDGHTSYFLQLF